MLRGLLAEFGMIFAQGVGHAIRFAQRVTAGDMPELPHAACDVVTDLSEQLLTLHARVNWYGRRMTAVAKLEPRIALLQTIPGIGPITAKQTIVAPVADDHIWNMVEMGCSLGVTDASGQKAKRIKFC